MTGLVILEIDDWQPELTPETQQAAVEALEGGLVLVLPRVRFDLSERERRFLSPDWSDGRAKNIALEDVRLKGAQGTPADLAELAAMIGRFARQATTLVATLFPRYAPAVNRARTSYRPQTAAGRSLSWRKDDTRLHVDAFPSRPNQGERILRVFSNLNPTEPRIWRIGDSFEAMAKTLLPRTGDPWPGSDALMAWLRITKGRRRRYDHLMLQLHDRAKEDLDYQRTCAQQEARFAPGTTWLCFSDQVMHAAVSGQYMLEQTIHLPVSAMYDRSRTPLAILERLTRRALVPTMSSPPVC